MKGKPEGLNGKCMGLRGIGRPKREVRRVEERRSENGIRVNKLEESKMESEC